MDIRHLTFFINVAEELNFRKAARNLNVTQPPVTRAIQVLEEELGQELFIREKQKIRLTEFGTYFYEKAKKQIKEFEALKKVPQNIKEHGDSLRIGYCVSAYTHFLPEMIEDFRVQYPSLHIDLLEYFSINDFEEKLLSNQIDFAFTYVPSKSKQLKFQNLFTEPIKVVVRDDNPLAEKESIGLPDLENQTIVFHPEEIIPDLRAYLTLLCNNHGFQPQITHNLCSQNSRLIQVSRYGGITIVVSSLREYCANNLRFKNIEIDKKIISELTVSALWNPKTVSKNGIKIMEWLTSKKYPSLLFKNHI
ncbi:MAG: LysR family transcriptional regulator [Cyclobacteriaceae bacterium]